MPFVPAFNFWSALEPSGTWTRPSLYGPASCNDSVLP